MWLLSVETHYKRTEPKPLMPLQRLSMYLTQIFSLLAVGGVVAWAADSDRSKKFLGGLGGSDEWSSDPATLFSWHPVMMVLAFTFCSTQAIFSYRYTFLHRNFGKLGQKLFHMMWHTVSFGFMIFGLYATIEWHRLRDVADLYSLHSWLGLTTVVLFTAQYFVGLWHFFFPGSRLDTRRAYHPMHVFVGILTYFTANFTIISGITDKNYSQQCWYSMENNKKDYNPAANYTRIPLGCRFSNGVGVLVFLTVMCASYTFMDMRATVIRKSARRSSFLDLE